MPTFDSNGVEIAYRVAGEGAPVLLIHGFGSNIDVNWGDTGWIATLADAGHRVVALDNRGHGGSDKLYDKQAYAAPLMAEDARRLLDHLDIVEADIMGYSMGARISAFLAIAHPARVRRLVLAGLAANMIEGVRGGEAIAQALEADSIADVTGAEPRAFRKFAEQTRSDLKALAACMRSAREKIDREALARIRCPVLVVAGELDDIAGPVAPLVDAIPNAKGVVLPRRNHMNAVGDRDYKNAVVEFLA
jgi:pimeloyl-ACP methyl ester carboxylesterase